MNFAAWIPGPPPWRGVVVITTGLAVFFATAIVVAANSAAASILIVAGGIATVLVLIGGFMLLATARRAGELRTFLLVSTLVTLGSTLVFQPEIFAPAAVVSAAAMISALRNAEERRRCRWTIPIAVLLLAMWATALVVAFAFVSKRPIG